MVQSYLNKKPRAFAGRWFSQPVWWLMPLLLAAGCQRDSIKVYRVAKDQNPPPSQSAPALPTDSPNPSLPPGHPDISSAPPAAMPAVAESAGPQLTWKTPGGWTEVPPSEMRVASFKVSGPDGKQADVSVVPLPGMPGSDEANVNRWRGQVGLSPVSPEELKTAETNVEAAGQPAQLYDLAGQNSGRAGADSGRHSTSRRRGVVFQNDWRRQSGGTAKAGVRRFPEIGEVQRRPGANGIAAGASAHRRHGHGHVRAGRLRPNFA